MTCARARRRPTRVGANLATTSSTAPGTRNDLDDAFRHRSPGEVVEKDRVVIRFAGDSGDGMQLTGDRFTSETAAFGNDLSTLPSFPAEIRAPAGTLPGVSSCQRHFANYDILTPGDRPDVLVAMNPAELKANLVDLPPGGLLIVNTDEFTKRNLTKVGYPAKPLEDGPLERFSVFPVAMGSYAVVQEGFGRRVAKTDEIDPDLIVVHDAGDHNLAWALSRRSDQDLTHTVTGVFRNVDRTTCDDATRAQVRHARETRQPDLQTSRPCSTAVTRGRWSVSRRSRRRTALSSASMDRRAARHGGPVPHRKTSHRPGPSPSTAR